VSPVKYELGFISQKTPFFIVNRRENLKSYKAIFVKVRFKFVVTKCRVTTTVKRHSLTRPMNVINVQGHECFYIFPCVPRDKC
jgi:hypothetical protein